MTSNNPPDVVLNLTMTQAEFLRSNCESNMVFALNAMQNGDLPRSAVEKLVALNEQFKDIKRLLDKEMKA